MGFKIKNSLTGEFEKLPILTLKGEKGETGGVEEYNKVDYMGNKYETLKQANDANVEYAVKTAIGEFNYLDYEGQHITATDTIEGRSKSAILKGQTLVNLISEGRQSSFHLNNTHGGGQAFWDSPNVNMIKPSTKYLILTNVTLNTGSRIIINNNEEYISCFTDGIYYEPNEVGIKKTILTSKSDLSDCTTILRSYTHTVGEVKGTIQVFEYQDGMENWNIPYFTGMSSVKMPVLTTTGKNLWDKKNFVNGVIDGESIRLTAGDLDDTRFYYDFKENQQYVFTLTSYSENKKLVYFRYNYTDGTDSGYTNFLPYNGETKSFISSANKTILYISFIFSDNDNYTLSNVQFEEGSAATPYEPHKSNTLSTPEDLELRGIGDVKDTLDISTGEKVERIGEIVLDGLIQPEGIYDQKGDTFGFFYPLNTITPKNYNQDLLIQTVKCDKLRIENHECQWMDGKFKDEEFISITPDGRLAVRLFSSKASTISEFCEYLSQKPITVQYQLATESIKTVDLSDNHVYSYKDVTHYDCSSAEGSLVPTLSVKVPTDVQATIAQQRETIQTLNSENERLNQIQEALKASMLDSQVQLMNLSWDTDFEVFTLRESIAPKDFLLDSRTGSNIDKFSQAKFIIENDCPDLEKLNSQIEYYFSKDVFSQEQFEELTDLINIVKGGNGCEY